MQVTNQRPYALVIAATDQEVGPGETVEVPDDLGRQLIEQPDNWAAKKSRSKED